MTVSSGLSVTWLTLSFSRAPFTCERIEPRRALTDYSNPGRKRYRKFKGSFRAVGGRASAGLGSRTCASAIPTSRGRAAWPTPRPFLTESRHRAKRAPAGSLPHLSGPVVRFLHRAMLFEVGEDGADDCVVFDAGHDPHRTAAVNAGAHVDAHQIAGSDLEQPNADPKGGGRDTRSKHALEALRPAHCAAALVGGALVRARSGRFRDGS